MHLFRLAKIAIAGLIFATPAFAKVGPPDGRWVEVEKGIPAAAQRAAICAQAKRWEDIRGNTFTPGGPDTDPQVCVVKGWKRTGAKSFQSIVSTCDPEPMGDSDGEIGFTMLDAQTMRMNNVIHILCPAR